MTPQPAPRLSTIRIDRRRVPPPVVNEMDVDDSESSDYKPSPPSPAKLPAKRGKGKKKVSSSAAEPAMSRLPAKGKEKAPAAGGESNLPAPTEKTPVAGDERVPPAKAPAKKSWENRRAPMPTGQNHETRCENCAKKDIDCQKEAGGGACVLCWTWKVKCMHSGAKKTRARQRKVPVGRSEVRVERTKKSTKYVEVTDEESPAPSPERPPAPLPLPAPRPLPAFLPETSRSPGFGHGG